MTSREQERRARQRATAKYGVIVHATIFAAVMLLLVVLNLVTSPGVLWFIWPLMGWGLAVALHAGGVFALGGGGDVIDRMTERELRRDGGRKHDGGS